MELKQHENHRSEQTQEEDDAVCGGPQGLTAAWFLRAELPGVSS